MLLDMLLRTVLFFLFMFTFNGDDHERLFAFVHEQIIWVGADQAELHRQKREWVIPPKRLMENVDYTGNECIVKVSIDMEFIL